MLVLRHLQWEEWIRLVLIINLTYKKTLMLLFNSVTLFCNCTDFIR